MKNTLIFFLLFCGFISAQNLPELEDRLEDLNKKRNLIETAVDSLQMLLKKDLDGNSSGESAALAGAFEITQQLKQKNAELNKVKEELKSVKNTLFELYGEEIISLQAKLRNAGNSETEKNLTRELIRFVEKQWAVNPLDNPFSFDIQKVQKIDLSSSTDSLETMILNDYLQKASLEVGQKIAALSSRENEIDRLLRLQSKTRDFLEESSESRPWQIKSQSAASQELAFNSPESRDKVYGGADYFGIQNTENFYLALRQLQDLSRLGRSENGNSRQLLEQIQQVKKTLQELDKYITNKMKPAK